MNKIPYTYSIIKYIHDPAVGESLNVGAIVLSPEAQFLDVKLDYHYERLSKTFAGFNGEQFKRTLENFASVLEEYKSEITGTLWQSSEFPKDIRSIVSHIWPDQGLSFQIGPILAGITPDPNTALQEIFDRMVASQYERQKRETRTDQEVWSTYHKPLIKTQAAKKLIVQVVCTPAITLKLDHVFKNDNLHILQPVSMDYAQEASIQEKASKWLGHAMGMEGYPDLGVLYLLLGRPQLAKHRDAYIRAKNLLHKMRIKHEFVEEEEADIFAQLITEYMKEHGLLPK
jgi:hypothetical protein